MDGQLLKKKKISHVALWIFHLRRPYSVFWMATFQILTKSLGLGSNIFTCSWPSKLNPMGVSFVVVVVLS